MLPHLHSLRTTSLLFWLFPGEAAYLWGANTDRGATWIHSSHPSVPREPGSVVSGSPDWVKENHTGNSCGKHRNTGSKLQDPSWAYERAREIFPLFTPFTPHAQRLVGNTKNNDYTGNRRHRPLTDIISVHWCYGVKRSTVLQLPGHFSVHEALLQSVCQPLVHQRVANESSAFSQRCSKLKT